VTGSPKLDAAGQPEGRTPQHPTSQPSVSANPTPDGILAYSARLHVVPVQCNRYHRHLRLRFSTTHVHTRVLEPAEWKAGFKKAARRIEEASYPGQPASARPRSSTVKVPVRFVSSADRAAETSQAPSSITRDTCHRVSYHRRQDNAL